MNLQKQNIAVVTHRSLMPDIPGGDLKKFLLKSGCNNLLYITHPLLLLKESYNLSSNLEHYKKNKLIKTFSAHHILLPEYISYVKDLLYTFLWILKKDCTFDFYFGANNINALTGLLLKKMGRVKKVIYYTIDLYPQRFENKFINWIYHKIDRLCVRFCDETWNVSSFLVKYRAKEGFPQTSKQYNVPIGIWFNEMQRVSLNKVNKNKLVYVGHLKDFYGVDLIIKALPHIIKKCPKIKLEIIGGGEQLSELNSLIKKLKVTSYVKFHGWREKKEAEQIMSTAAIGLAPFNTTLLNQARYKSVSDLIKNGDPAKIKDYLALGLPVVMTKASFTSRIIEKAGCATIVQYTPQSLATAVVALLTDDSLFKKYRDNALKYIKQFDWNIIFTKNLTRLTKHV